MKRIILTIAIAISALITVAQPKVTKDVNGNYVQVKSVKDSVSATKTGKTFTDLKGNVYPVMQSKKGKLFVVRTAKVSGKTYNQYIN